jgi:hypothetical protein
VVPGRPLASPPSKSQALNTREFETADRLWDFLSNAGAAEPSDEPKGPGTHGHRERPVFRKRRIIGIKAYRVCQGDGTADLHPLNRVVAGSQNGPISIQTG